MADISELDIDALLINCEGKPKKQREIECPHCGKKFTPGQSK